MMSSSSTAPSASDEVIDRFLANVDVWQAIFQMLTVKDRIRLEMTNKRLGMMMLEYWKRVTSFDTTCLMEISPCPWTSKDREKLSAAFVIICVNRMGDGLRSLIIHQSLTTSLKGFWNDNLRSVGEECPNIETIHFAYEDEYVSSYEDEYWPFDIHFDSFNRLKTLTVSRDESIKASASIFLSIPTSIEVIHGLEGKREEPFENATQMEGFFADRPSLREVCLFGLRTRDESKADIFRVIAQRCPNLKSIYISAYFCIDYTGVIALESMKELFIRQAIFDEKDIVTICERSPLVEAIELGLRFSSNLHLQSAALNALGSLTKLAELGCFDIESADVVAPSMVTEFVRELARNSGASLRRLRLHDKMPLPRAAVEALANGCAKLRYLFFRVRVGEATPASIRFLIDSIVAHPSWITQTGEPTLVIYIYVMHDSEDEYEAGLAAFKALAAPAANLPSGVELTIRKN